MNNTKQVTIAHDVINFKVPAALKAEFAWAAGKDERTISQQLRILMAQYVAESDDYQITKEEIEAAAKNVSKSIATKNIKPAKPKFTRGK